MKLHSKTQDSDSRAKICIYKPGEVDCSYPFIGISLSKMQSAGLQTHLAALNSTVLAAIPGTRSVRQYLGTYQGQKVIIKAISVPADSDYNAIYRKYEALLSIDHPNVLRIMHCSWMQENSQWQLVIITEMCELNLGKHISERARTGQFWSEAEAWDLLRVLVATFAYLQEQGIDHRDIKAGNIFLSTEGVVKIGNFAEQGFAHIDEGLKDSPLYFSPLLKSAFLNRQPNAVHDVYKSDVYALGITMLHVLSLAPPMSLMNASDLEQATLEILNPLYWYSHHLKVTIIWMVKADESQRYDFKALHANLQQPQMPMFPAEQADLLASMQTDSPVPEAVAIQPESRSVADRIVVKCLGCQRDFRRKELREAVQLYCNPIDHVYCTIDCFREYLQENEAVCPKCQVPFPPEIMELKKVGWKEWVLKKLIGKKGK